ncbi:hypothetical protein PoB_003173400 [Plakobranchus ocellatus]|uniref:Uncharacterized protein n=1 Tax=Plakobranchus ocellatus TaxID=259542 RepID=A0AAV4AFM3_9GAST|nr:hypothetical protein PoB_003173400 [Plakobranchus ocellatus]
MTNREATGINLSDRSKLPFSKMVTFVWTKGKTFVYPSQRSVWRISGNIGTIISSSQMTGQGQMPVMVSQNVGHLTNSNSNT